MPVRTHTHTRTHTYQEHGGCGAVGLAQPGEGQEGEHACGRDAGKHGAQQLLMHLAEPAAPGTVVIDW